MKLRLALVFVWLCVPVLGAQIDWIAFVAQADGGVRALRTEVFSERGRTVSERVSLVLYDANGKLVAAHALPAKLAYRDLTAVGKETYVLANRVERGEFSGRVPTVDAIEGRNELVILRVSEHGDTTEHRVQQSRRVDDEGVTLAVDAEGRAWVAASQASPSTQQELFRMTADLKRVDASFPVPSAEATCAAQFLSRLTPSHGFLFFAADVRTSTSDHETLPFIHWYSGVAEENGAIRWMNEKPFESPRRRRESDHLGAAVVGKDGRTLFVVRGSGRKVRIWRRGSAGGAQATSIEVAHSLGTTPVYANRGAVSLLEDGTLVVAGKAAKTSDVVLSFVRGPELVVETRVLVDALK